MTSAHPLPPETDRPGAAVPGPPLPLLPGPWSARTARAGGADLDLVHGWMQSPHIDAFWHQAWPRERWHEEIAGHLAGVAVRPVLVALDGEPVAYIEVYRVLRDRLTEHYAYHPRDLGVHIAVGEEARTGKGLGRTLLRALAEGLLAADPACPRVVAEPDAANTASLRAFGAAGYRRIREITLPEKTAVLLCHPRREEDLPR
ncbi:GNAT family N-acetyltransferase [Streptomyces sp. NPDC090445]|uniref:GNAT family N-acetyltransferase n=1 Tax=Streptomyces sp. NPDC090445 TaxID=3365963 RepID=UPI003808922F